MDFINQVSIACANVLIADTLRYTDELFEMCAEKCINLVLPNKTDYNVEIIERELKETQNYIFSFITTCDYALEKCQTRSLKHHVRHTKNETRKILYKLIGKEVTTNEDRHR